MTWLLAAFVAAAAVAPARAAERPNVVILDICSARADRMGFNGYSARPTTPHLDALASRSAVFDHALAQGSWCLPNYASLLTGHVAEVHGMYTNLPFRPLPSFETTLAQRLRESGYRTGGFTGGVYFLPSSGLDRGFDRFVNRFSTATEEAAPFSQIMPGVLDWIGRGGQKPFFVYATIDDLHAPYQSPDPRRFDPGYSGVAESTAALSVRFDRAYNGERLDPSDPLNAVLADFRRDPRALAHLSARYDAAVASVDDEIGRFVERLKKLGVWERTILIVTGDHGELLGEHGLLGHTESLYDPVLRVPLLVHDPRDPRGRRFHELVERVDLMPTVLDFAGASDSWLELQGRSLLPLLQGAPTTWRRYAFASSKRNEAERADFTVDERVVQDERWKLHAYLYKDRYELYDLAADPGERRDVAAEHPDVVARLSFELLKRLELTRPHAPGLPSGAAPSRDSGLAPSQR